MTTAATALPDSSTHLASALRRVSCALASQATAEQSLRTIADEALDLTGAVTVSVGLLDESEGMLDIVAASGKNAAEMRGLKILAGHSLAQTVLQTGEAAILGPDEGSSAVGYRSAAVAPIKRDGIVVGALIAVNKQGDTAFTIEDTDHLSLFADHASVALRLAHSSTTASRKSRELAVLFESARTITGTLNVQDVISSLLNAVCDHFEHHAAALFLLNDERTHLFIAADRGLAEEEREIQLYAEDPSVTSLMRDGKPVLIEAHHRNGGDVLSISERTKSSLVAPIRGHTEPLGLLILASTQSDVYTASDLELLGAVAAQSGIAISNAWLYEDATRQAEEAGALYELSQHVNATLHLDRVFQFVADSVVGVLKVDKFALMLLDPEENRLVTKVTRGVDAQRFASIRPTPGQGIPGWVFEWMTPTAVADVPADARNASAPIQGEDVVSTICVPIAVGDDVIGVMMGMSSKRRFFTVAEMELLYTIANQAAVAIANANLYRDARAKSAEMHRYFRGVAKALGSALEARDLPQLLADLAVEVMRADRCAIYRTEGDSVRVHATSHFRMAGPPDPEIPLGDGLTGWVAKRGKVLAIEALMEDARTQAHGWLTKERLASYLAVPLKMGRKTVGVIEIFTQDARSFNDEEIKLLSQFARRARVAERLVPLA